MENSINKTVIKISGDKEAFSESKIIRSITLALKDTKHLEVNPQPIADLAISEINMSFPSSEISAEAISHVVERIFLENGLGETARYYMMYRENKRHAQQDKASLGVVDDIGLSYNTLYILKRRYLRRDEQGNIVETPKQMIERVAKFLSTAEKKSEQQKWYQNFYEIMINFDFLPGTRTLTNSGKKDAQLANCFVWPLKDDINEIFNILHKSTLIKKNGGGCGYNFSKLRPEGDSVGGIPDLAAGPVKIIEMFDLMTSLFRQEGRYESGNMAILNASHPDIFNFITAKQKDGYLSKTNISVGVTDEFMRAAIDNRNWDLINPRNGKVVNTVKARSILELMSRLAWQTGDPGLINLSAINKKTPFGNPLVEKHGMIEATNPCGEVPLYPYESCNLGYVNFTKFTANGEFDFKRFREVIKVATRLMDNVIDVSVFPVKEVTDSVKAHRRLGIGCVGWAEALVKLNIAYDSNVAIELAEKVTKWMYESAFEASCEIAKEKGTFPLISDSIWKDKKVQPRNVAVLSFAPSSGNAVICETSFAIEPFFALAYEQNVLGGVRLKTVNPLLIEKLKEKGLYNDDLIQKIVDNHGSIQNINEIPDDIKRIFKVAHDISWQNHIKMQAAFQKWTDNAITKTINMPGNATPQDVYEAYVMAWKLGCKGLTVYRDNSKSEQVFNFGGNNSVDVPLTKCPDCNEELVKGKNCLKCKKCGFSVCER